mgnify:CR=1 FL=1
MRLFFVTVDYFLRFTDKHISGFSMLQSFRDNLKGTVATFLVTLISIPFVLFGVDALFVQNGAAGEAATINGESISEQELRQSIFLQKQQMIARFGDQLPASLISDERLRGPVLENMVQQRLLAQDAVDGGMAAGDAVLDQMIVANSQFHSDGRFNRELYKQLLRRMGYTAIGYRQLLGRDMLLNQHSNGLSGSGFVTPAELARTAALSQQTRSFYALTLPLADVLAEQSVTDAAVEAHYQAQQSDYMAAEQIALEYIEVKAADLVEDLQFSEAQLRAQYEQNVDAFEASTTRRAAHLLLEPREDGSEQALAEQLQERLAAGEDFAALVAEFSEDASSSEQGGDLGFTAGDIFPEAFEEALAQLQVGETSGVVSTDAGLHIIKLLEEQGSEAPSFEEQRDAIASALRAAEADSLFVELLESLADLTYNAESLGDAANELGLQAGRTELFGRNGGEGLASETKILAVAFGDEVLQEGNTSEVIELSDDHVAVIRLAEHKPAHIRPLADVREAIVETLKREQAEAQLASRAAALEAQLREGADAEAVAKESNLEWQVNLAVTRRAPKVDSEVLSAAFALPKPDTEPSVAGLHLAGGDYVIVSLTKVADGELASLGEAERSRLQTALARSAGTEEYTAYQAWLQDRADVEIP